MEYNDSKQIILSIIGLLVLVIAVVGVSFAFFNYSKNGEKNNVITTGSITFSLYEGELLTLNGINSFPKSIVDGSTSDNYTRFYVTGTLPEGSTKVTYNLYAIAGDAPDENPPNQTDEDLDKPRIWHRFKDNEIMIKLTGSGDVKTNPETGAGTITIEDGYDQGKTAGQLYNIANDPSSGALENGFILATGTMSAGESIDHSYDLRMWIDGGADGESGLKISDTDYSANYRGTDVKKGNSPFAYEAGSDNSKNLPQGIKTDDRLVYTDMYYSIKIKITATDAN